MKLKELLEEFPWDETYRRLCGDPPDQSQLPLDRAKTLIDEQRDSQLQVLARAMYGPRLVPGSPPRSDEPEARKRKLPRFEFNDAEQAAHTFLRTATQVGASLRLFTLGRLAELDAPDASLGRLLRLLAIAEESPDRLDPEGTEWFELKEAATASGESSPFGPVLGPMLFLAGSAGESVAEGSDYDLIRPLVAELGATDRVEGLAKWTSAVVEAGSRHIAKISPLPYPRELSLEVAAGLLGAFIVGASGARARDIVLAGRREENVDFLREVEDLDGVVKEETGFIYEPEPGLVRLRAWSKDPLEVENLTHSADVANAKVIEVLDDTVI